MLKISLTGETQKIFKGKVGDIFVDSDGDICIYSRVKGEYVLVYLGIPEWENVEQLQSFGSFRKLTPGESVTLTVQD